MAFLGAVVAWSLKNRVVVLGLTLVFVAFGLRAMFTLQIDAVPDVTSVQVQVITAAPALSPVEVEQYVTVPVERAMSGVPYVTEIRSVSKYGLSVVTIVFTDTTDVYFARLLVNERMRQAEQAIPANYGKPVLGPVSSGLGEIVQFTLENDDLSLMQLDELFRWYVAPALRTVPGVVEVNGFGGQVKQYQIVLDPKRLQAAGLSVEEVAKAVERANENAGGGYIEHAREHFVIGTDGLFKGVEDIQKVVVGVTPQGVPITVAAVGDVELGPALRGGAASKDGHGEVVAGVVLMLTGENALVVTEAVKAKLAELEPTLPKGTRVTYFYDRSKLVLRTMRTVGKNLLEGALLVIVVLLLLLGDLRAGIVVAVTIPLAMLFTISVMNVSRISGNLMSLGALDFGLIVDGAVIIVENAVRRLAEAEREKGRKLSVAERLDVVHYATLEVRAATVFGEAIIAIVYVPVLSLLGVEGKLFRPMATTVLLALLGAFIFSLTVVPVLTSYLVKSHDGDGETWLLRMANKLYVPALGFVLRRGRLTLAIAGVALLGAAAMFLRLGAEFIPQLDEGDMLVEARRLPGIALSESVSTDLRMQKALKGIPEVRHAVSKTGAPALATDPMGLEQSDVYLALKEREQWRPGLTTDDLAKEIMEAVELSVPEVAGGISQPIRMRTNELVVNVKSDVAAIVYGPDLEDLATHGEKIAAAVRKVNGAVDVRVEQVAGLRYLRVVPDRARLARHGITIDDLNRVTEAMAVGHEVGTVFQGDRRFGLVIKTRHGFQGDLRALAALPLRSSTGHIVPLGEVAELRFMTGPAQISRDKGSRRLSVEFNVRGRDLVSVVSDAQAAVAKAAPLPPQYRLEWGGRFEHFVAAKSRLLVVVPLALGLIGFLLWMAFSAVRPAAVIFLNVPFAAIGGIAALWIRDIPFSISAGVGFIALFGVAVLNGLVLTSFARQVEAGGASKNDAIKRAAELRLRPVLMTALVASLGFVPMAISQDPGSEVQRPLATVVIGGLFTATLLTLLVLPVVYTWLVKPLWRRPTLGW